MAARPAGVREGSDSVRTIVTFAAAVLFVLAVQGKGPPLGWLDDAAVWAVDAYRWTAATREASLAAAATASTRADYTVTGKQLVGLRVTYVAGGSPRTAPVPWDCYAAAAVGTVLPAVVPGPNGPVSCRGGN